MFTSLLDTPLPLMTLGAQAHNTLNAAMIDEISAVMQKHDWTCHVCGTRLPGMMEVDHLKGHKVSAKDGLAPICQVCHDRKHLLWAAGRKRITFLHAPDLSYVEISQLTWALTAHSGRDGFDVDRRKLARDFNARQEDAFDAIGHDNVEAIFEAILTMADSKGIERTRERCAEIDRHIRIVPTLLLDDEADIKVWSAGGFRSPREDWRDTALAGQSVGYDALRRAGEALKSRL